MDSHENNDVTYRIRLQGITKQYPGCLANDNIDFSIRPGEIRALLGENGAGKSTLMKIIFGVVKADSGTIYWEGKETVIPAPAVARHLGIGMVFQHFSLFETLSVTENIALSMDKEMAADMKGLADRIREVSVKYGMALEPDRMVHSLSTGERQRVEIVRCLVQNPKLLILDEPTSVLTPQEADTLFDTLRQLSREGCSVLFISHKLHEVRALCESATIMRAGRVTGECTPSEESSESIARMMVGDDTPVTAEHEKSKSVGEHDYLTVENLSLKSTDPFGSTLKNISFSVKPGEILGVAGVAGNGQEELLAALSGETIIADNNAIRFPDGGVGNLGPAPRRALGLCFVPEDRLGRGAVPDMSLHDNALLTASGLPEMVENGLINKQKVEEYAEKIISEYNVKAAGTHAAAKSLSGGNLQKYIIGREVLQEPKLLVASHPTWGVDIGAAISIHKALVELRDQGAAILVISEDLDELFEISDRMCAVYDGEMSPSKPTADTTIEEVGQWMAGVFGERLNQANDEGAKVVTRSDETTMDSEVVA